MQSVYHSFLDMKQLMEKSRRDMTMVPYLLEFFNIKMLHRSDDVLNEHAFQGPLMHL